MALPKLITTAAALVVLSISAASACDDYAEEMAMAAAQRAVADAKAATAQQDTTTVQTATTSQPQTTAVDAQTQQPQTLAMAHRYSRIVSD